MASGSATLNARGQAASARYRHAGIACSGPRCRAAPVAAAHMVPPTMDRQPCEPSTSAWAANRRDALALLAAAPSLLLAQQAAAVQGLTAGRIPGAMGKPWLPYTACSAGRSPPAAPAMTCARLPRPVQHAGRGRLLHLPAAGGEEWRAWRGLVRDPALQLPRPLGVGRGERRQTLASAACACTHLLPQVAAAVPAQIGAAAETKGGHVGGGRRLSRPQACAHGVCASSPCRCPSALPTWAARRSTCASAVLRGSCRSWWRPCCASRECAAGRWAD
jgi:hypothetical protein